MSTKPLWLAQRERGSAWLIRAIAKIALAAGRPVGRMLLYPICAYFLVFSRGARGASLAYLRRALSRPPNWLHVYRHLLCFAQTILDRVYLLSGRFADFDCKVEGVDALHASIDQGRGCLLVGAHFGSFDVLRVFGRTECPVRVHVLMHEGNAEKVNAVLRALDPDWRSQIIRLGQPHTMLRVAEALHRGEIVAMLADRAVAGDKLVRCEFLGADAPFPEGPFVLAAMLRVPVVLFSAAYERGRRYRIRFEPFAEHNALAGEDRANSVEACCRRYAQWLSVNCRSAPYNWFNFYDFWAHDASRRI